MPAPLLVSNSEQFVKNYREKDLIVWCINKMTLCYDLLLLHDFPGSKPPLFPTKHLSSFGQFVDL